jgi:two-component system sensor histidine kinase MtrB
VRVEDGAAPVVSDPRRAERVVANLVENALAHGGGDVTVRVAADGDTATVDVIDCGPGIPPEELPRLFERFAKGDPARSGPGTGLGLAIARENARLLGGDVEAASEPGAGSRFTLRLPVT